jgi:hypothetical protein
MTIDDILVEKYLKGYLEYIGFIPEKKHNKFANDIRYPNRYETNENDVNFCISAVKKIKDFELIKHLRNIKEDTDKL